MTVAEVLETLLNEITFTGVTPNIRQLYANKTAYHNAELLIGDWAKNDQSNQGGSKRFNNFTVMMELTINNEIDQTDLGQIIDDIETKFDLENIQPDRGYYFEMIYEFNNIVKSTSLPITVRMRQLPV